MRSNHTIERWEKRGNNKSPTQTDKWHRFVIKKKASCSYQYIRISGNTCADVRVSENLFTWTTLSWKLFQGFSCFSGCFSVSPKQIIISWPTFSSLPKTSKLAVRGEKLIWVFFLLGELKYLFFSPQCDCSIAN